jgi:serine/threonine-protein kinase
VGVSGISADRVGEFAQPMTRTLIPGSPPVGPARPARQFDPESRRLADEIAALVQRRLLAGTAIAAVAFALMMLLALGTPQWRSDYLSLTLYAVMTIWYAAMVMYLARRRGMPLTRLRVVEVLALTPYAAYCAWKDFWHYSRYLATLPADDQWLLVSHTCLLWVFLIFIYGILMPNDWRRSLRVLATLAVIPLVVYGVTWLTFPESRRPVAPLFDLFSMARVMAAAVAIAVFGAHKFSTLQREASEARHLGNYRIKRRISAGGIGEVYLAEHRTLNRPYAIKLIRADVAANPTSRARFAREIQAMARLTHWNTIEIVDYGHAPDGTFYYVMEYVKGLNLNELVNRHGPVSPGRAVYLLRQACASLAEAHDMGLIHRDIKPGNIMLTQLAGLFDVVKVLDFGLVHDIGPSDGDDRLTQPGLLIGTPGYMSPEQGTGTGVRSDIYSLGAVGYFLLTGQAPFRGREMQQFRAEPTPLRDLRPEVPSDLEAVILKCLRCDPEARYADVEQVDAALAACDCASSWNSGEAESWWRVTGDPALATTEAPGAGAPNSETSV